MHFVSAIVRNEAAGVITINKLRMLEEAGMTVVPKAWIEEIKNCESEIVLWIEGKPVIVSPASANDIERVARGIIFD